MLRDRLRVASGCAQAHALIDQLPETAPPIQLIAGGNAAIEENPPLSWDPPCNRWIPIFSQPLNLPRSRSKKRRKRMPERGPAGTALGESSARHSSIWVCINRVLGRLPPCYPAPMQAGSARLRRL